MSAHLLRGLDTYPSSWHAFERAESFPQPKRALAASMSSAVARTMRYLVEFCLIGKPSRPIVAINLLGEHALHVPEEVS